MLQADYGHKKYGRYAHAHSNGEKNIVTFAPHHQGQTQEQKRDVEQRLDDAGMDFNADVGAETHAAIAQSGDQLGGGGKVFKAHSARELLEIQITGDEALVGFEPVGPIMGRNQDRPAGRKQRRPRIEMFWFADFIE